MKWIYIWIKGLTLIGWGFLSVYAISAADLQGFHGIFIQYTIYFIICFLDLRAEHHDQFEASTAYTARCKR